MRLSFHSLSIQRLNHHHSPSSEAKMFTKPKCSGKKCNKKKPSKMPPPPGKRVSVGASTSSSSLGDTCYKPKSMGGLGFCGPSTCVVRTPPAVDSLAWLPILATVYILPDNTSQCPALMMTTSCCIVRRRPLQAALQLAPSRQLQSTTHSVSVQPNARRARSRACPCAPPRPSRR